MVLREVEIAKKEGVSNRDAQELVRHAMRYDCEIIYEFGRHRINAKSIMGVISMGLNCGDKLVILATGDDDESAADDLCELFKQL